LSQSLRNVAISEDRKQWENVLNFRRECCEGLRNVSSSSGDPCQMKSCSHAPLFAIPDEALPAPKVNSFDRSLFPFPSLNVDP
jgi:hypothetical protein